MSANNLAGIESTGTTTAESSLETTTAIDWDGALCEHEAYGPQPVDTYVRRCDCGIAVRTGQRAYATYRSEWGHR